MDLCQIFFGNFQSTYAHPRKKWKLRNCKQKLRSLHDYIRCFSKRCTEVLDATDNNTISAFENGTTCTTLVHRLGRMTPRTTQELHNIATNHTDGEEAVVDTLIIARGHIRASRKRRRTTSIA
jgi:hypothetical protein